MTEQTEALLRATLADRAEEVLAPRFDSVAIVRAGRVRRRRRTALHLGGITIVVVVSLLTSAAVVLALPSAAPIDAPAVVGTATVPASTATSGPDEWQQLRRGAPTNVDLREGNQIVAADGGRRSLPLDVQVIQAARVRGGWLVLAQRAEADPKQAGTHEIQFLPVGGAGAQVLVAGLTPAVEYAISPDGRILAVVREGGDGLTFTVVVFELPSLVLRANIDGDRLGGTFAAVRFMGNRLVITSFTRPDQPAPGPRLSFYNLDTGSLEGEPDVPLVDVTTAGEHAFLLNEELNCAWSGPLSRTPPRSPEWACDPWLDRVEHRGWPQLSPDGRFWVVGWRDPADDKNLQIRALRTDDVKAGRIQPTHVPVPMKLTQYTNRGGYWEDPAHFVIKVFEVSDGPVHQGVGLIRCDLAGGCVRVPLPNGRTVAEDIIPRYGV